MIGSEKMTGTDFKVLLSATLSDKTRIQIENDLKQIAKHIDPVSLGVDIDVNDLKRLEDSLVKVSKVNFKNKDMTRIVSTMNTKLGETVKVTRDIKKGVADVVTTMESVDYGKQNKYLEDTARIYRDIENISQKIFKADEQYDGFIDKKALDDMLTSLTSINVDTVGLTTNLKDVKAQISSVDKQFNAAEKSAEKLSIAVKTAQTKQELEQVTKREKQELEQQANLHTQIGAIIDNNIDAREKAGKMFSAQLKEQMESQYRLGEKMAKDTEDEIKRGKKRSEQEREIALLKKQSQATLDSIKSSNAKADVGEYERLSKAIREVNPLAENAKIEMKELNHAINQYGDVSKAASKASDTFGDSLKRMGIYFGFYDVIQLGKRGIREMVESVFELDEAIVELNKVAQVDDMSQYVKDMYALGESLGKTGSQMTQISAGFARAGYRDSDLKELANVAGMMMNVGDSAMTLDDSVGALVSSMKGFKLETKDSMNLLHSMNNVANNSNNTMSDLTMGLQRTAGTMGAFGVEYEKVIGMFGSVNEILMSPEMVSRGLNSLTMRIRGLSESGESIDGLAPKLEKLYKGIGVSITDANGQLLDIYTIMGNLNKVWGTLTPNMKQYIAQQSSGIEQAKTFITLQENWGRATEITQQAINHQSSALAENERVMDSLQGKMSKVKSSWEQLANNTVDSDFVKNILDTTNSFIKLIDSIGVGNIAIGVFASTMLGITTSGVTSKIKEMNLGFSNMAQISKLAGISIKDSLGSMATSLFNPLTLTIVGVGVALTTAMTIFDKANITLEEQTQKVNALRTEYEEINKQLDELNSKEVKSIADNQQIEILELQADLLDKNIQKAEQLRIEKELFGKGVAFENGEFDNMEQMIDNYQLLQSQIEASTKTLEEYKNKNQDGIYNNDIIRQTEHIESLYGQLDDTMLELIESEKTLAYASSVLTGEDKERVIALQERVHAEIDKRLATRDDESATRDLAGANEDLSSSNSKVIGDYSVLNQTIKEHTDGVTMCNQAINSLADGQTLTADTILKLIETYPELMDKVELVNGVYTISADVLTNVRDAHIDKANSAIDAEIQETINLKSQTESRIIMYQAELEALKVLMQARSALDTFGSGIGSKNKDMFYGSQIHETEQKIDAAKKETELYDKSIQELEIKKKKFDIATNQANVKKGSNISNKSPKDKASKEQDKWFKSEIDRIQNMSLKLQAELDKKQNQLTLAVQVGDVKGQEKLIGEIAKLQAALKDKNHEQANELRLLATKTSKEEQLIQIEQELNKTSNEWYGNRKAQLEKEVELLSILYDKKEELLKKDIESIENEKILMKESSEEYLAKEREKLDIVYQLQVNTQDKIDALKAQGYSNEAKEVKSLLDAYVDYEKEILTIMKNISEKTQKMNEERLKKEQESNKEKIESQKKMHDLAIAMIKKEEEAKKKALEKEKKEFKESIDARKKAIDSARKAEDHKDDVAEKTKEIDKIKKELMKLEGDGSAEARKLELLEELAKKEKELKDTNRDYEDDQRKDALDKEYDEFEKLQDAKIKEIEDFVSQEGKLREEANKRFKNSSKKMYEDMKKYTSSYTDLTEFEFEEMWTNCVDSAKLYNNGLLDVIETMNELVKVSKQLETDIKLNDETKPEVSHPGKPEIGENGDSAKSMEQKNMQKYLHDQMVLAKKSGNKGLESWVKQQRLLYGLDPDTGAIIQKWHTGLNNGRVGDNLKPNEMIAKLTKDEWVLTGKQYDNLTNNINSLLNSKSESSMPSIQMGDLIVQGNLDSSCIDEVRTMMKKQEESLFDRLLKSPRFGKIK